MAIPLPRQFHHLRLASPAKTAAPPSPSSSFCSFFLSASRTCSVRLAARGSGLGGHGGFPLLSLPFRQRRKESRTGGGGRGVAVKCSSTTAGSGSSWWQDWLAPPASAAAGPRLSDIVWPSAGAFLAMALLGRMDQIIAQTGQSFTIAPLGAVCAVLFATPATPGARKYNIFMAQIGCAAFGVLALYVFGPGWLARGTALAASMAFMIATRAIHPPAASLPILFIDGAKFHKLHFWYALFPGAAGCTLLCLIQELVAYLKENYKF